MDSSHMKKRVVLLKINFLFYLIGLEGSLQKPFSLFVILFIWKVLENFCDYIITCFTVILFKYKIITWDGEMSFEDEMWYFIILTGFINQVTKFTLDKKFTYYLWLISIIFIKWLLCDGLWSLVLFP